MQQVIFFIIFPENVINNMLILVVVLPSAMVGIAFLVLLRFPLTEAKVAENRKILDARHARMEQEGKYADPQNEDSEN